MAIKDLQTLYEEGHVATTLDGSELLLVEQNGLSKVVTVGTLAQYFMAYFEANSTCCGEPQHRIGLYLDRPSVGDDGALFEITIDGIAYNVEISSGYDDWVQDSVDLVNGLSIAIVAYSEAHPQTEQKYILLENTGSSTAEIIVSYATGVSPDFVPSTPEQVLDVDGLPENNSFAVVESGVVSFVLDGV